jgi:hypothetical protein
LSSDPIDTPLSLRCSTSRGTVPRPTPSTARPPERLSSVEKSSARRSGFHCGTTLNMVPSVIRSVRPAIHVDSWSPFGMTSKPSYWKWCSVVQKLS